jgi:CNT family concentrative nucleoside transporter
MLAWVSSMGFIGILSILLFSWLISENKHRISWKLVFWGLGLQFTIAILVMGIPSWGVPALLKFFFLAMNTGVEKFLSFSDIGAEFLFGPLVSTEKMQGFVFAVKVLPTIVFFSALVSVLYFFGILQAVILFFAVIMKRSLGVRGAESLSLSAQIFLGQTEAPLLIRPYISKLTRSELFAVMVGGMATIAGGVMAAYVALLRDKIPDIAGHLLTASLMSAPAAFVVSKMLIPENVNLKDPALDDSVNLEIPNKDANVIDAAARGASEGLILAFNVGAMLLVFVALVAMLNSGIEWAGSLFGIASVSFQSILAILLTPLAFLLGIPWQECQQIASLIGQKVVLNEFVAYIELANLKENLSEKSLLIASYALCGFANFSSIGIQVGGIGGMAPERRSEVATLGLKAVLAGNLAAFMTAAIAGLLI